MLIDGIKLTDTSVAENLNIVNGNTLPISNMNVGELFYLNGAGLHVYNGSTWTSAAGGSVDISSKVDKINGKDLSSNDFTNSYKSKLELIEAQATKNSADAQLRDRSSHTGEQPISSITNLQIALDAKDTALDAHVGASDPHPQYTTSAEASAAAPVQSVAGKTGAVILVKSDVGLPNVDNTTDAAKPISTAQAAINAGKAPLNGAGTSGTWPISVTGNAATASSVSWDPGITGKPAVIAAGATAADARSVIGALGNEIYQLSISRLNKDANDVYTTIEQRRADGTLFQQSILSGGTSPKYTVRTVKIYAANGTSVVSTFIFNLSYTGDDLVSEVLA